MSAVAAPAAAAGAVPEPQEMSPLMLKPTLLVLKDGRQIAGFLCAFDHAENIVLQICTVLRKYVSPVDQKETVTRNFATILTIRRRDIEAFYQRDEAVNGMYLPQPQEEQEEAAAAALAEEKKQLQIQQAAAAAAAAGSKKGGKKAKKAAKDELD